MISIDPGDIAKLVSLGASIGGGFAAVRPFAQRAFEHWLTRAAELAKQKRDDEQRVLAALERGARDGERTVGVLEAICREQERTSARLDAIEAHLGVPAAYTAVPAPGEHVSPRVTITGGYPAVGVAAPEPAAAPAPARHG